MHTAYTTTKRAQKGENKTKSNLFYEIKLIKLLFLFKNIRVDVQ